MIFVNGKGGFGNQLYHLFFALFLKQHYQTDIYYIIYGNPHQQYEIKMIFDIFPKTKKYINYADEIFLKTVQKQYNVKFFQGHTYKISDLPELKDDPILFKITSYLEIEKMFLQLTPELRSSLEINPEIITKEVNYLSKQKFAMMHIRYGDKLCRALKGSYGETLLNRKFDHFPVISPQYYLDMIDKFRKDKNIEQVYLISDSNELVKKYILNPANNNSKPFVFLLDVPYWEAFYLLTKANTLVNSLSTFSYGAAYLNKIAKHKDIHQLIRKEERTRHDDQAISPKWNIIENKKYILNYDQELVKEMVDFYGKCQEYEDWYRKSYKSNQSNKYQSNKAQQKNKPQIRNICCQKLFIKPLFPYVQKGEYMEPIRQWVNHFGDPYHKQLLKENRKTDEVMLRYIQCRPRMRAIISNQPPSKNVNVVYKKSLHHLSSEGVKSLLFQLYSVQNIEKAQNFISSTQTNSSSTPTVYFYEVSETPLQQKDFPGAIYSAGWFMETILTAKLTLHRNNRFQLEHINLDRFLNLPRSIIKLSTFLYQLHQNYSQLEIEQIHLSSGILALSLGARDITDLDIGLLPAKNDQNTQHLKELPSHLRFEVDIAYMNDFKDKRKYVYHDSIKHLLANDDQQVKNDDNLFYHLYHPRAYYYFYGIKLETFQLTYTIWRYWRNRPRSVAELVFLNDQYQINFPIAEIPKIKLYTDEIRYLTYPMLGLQIKLGEMTEEEVKKKGVPYEESHFLKVVSRYLKSIYNHHLENDEIKEIILQAPKNPHEYPSHLF